MPEAETLETCDKMVGGGIMSYPCVVKIEAGKEPGDHPGPCMSPEVQNSVRRREMWERTQKSIQSPVAPPAPSAPSAPAGDPQFDPRALESRDMTQPVLAGEMSAEQAAAILAQTQGPAATFQEAIGETDRHGNPTKGAAHPDAHKGDWDPTTTETRPGALAKDHPVAQALSMSPPPPAEEVEMIVVGECPHCGGETSAANDMSMRDPGGMGMVAGRLCPTCKSFFSPATTYRMTSPPPLIPGQEATLNTAEAVAAHQTFAPAPSPAFGEPAVQEAQAPDPRYRDPNTVYPDEPERANREGDREPLPTPNDRPLMHDEMIKDIEARKALGIKRYGVALQPLNGRDAAHDAYEEALDMAVYLRQVKYEHSIFAGRLREIAAMHDEPTIAVELNDIADALDPQR